MGLYILQIAIAFIIVVDILYWNFSKIKSPWDKLLGLPFLNIAVGTPIIFTSLTRSVFEVSKLLNVRIALIWIVAVVLLRAILNKERLQFIKTPLNWPLLAFVIVNIFSAIFSSNHYIALLGAYDRWEGLITELNYMLLVFFYINYVRDRKTLFWILGALVIGTVFSAIYGVFQSVGLDFMRWSVDPAARVFGCINNPVHYAPYVVMHIPLLIGLVFYYIQKFKLNGLQAFKNTRHAVFLLTGLISIMLLYFVGNFLSFGRATWIGFSLSIALCLAILLARDPKEIWQDVVFTGYGCFLFNAWYVFKVYAYHKIMLYGLIAASLLYLAYIVFVWLRRGNWLKLLMFTLTVMYGGLLQFTSVDINAIAVICLSIIFLNFWIFRNFPNTLERLTLNFVLIGFMLVIVIPSAPNLYASNLIKITLSRQGVKNLNDPHSAALIMSEVNNLREQKKISDQSANIFFRTQTYAEAFNKGTARTSMWKTGSYMLRDAPLLGQGPGMIKEMYPKYRRADYGVLEGGHQFTPDKLHNDYVNMLATRGLLGFGVYYLWLLPLGFFIILRKLWREGFTPGNYVLIGLFSGLFVYLGQVLFNFGVVATRVIFYEFFCLALCLALYDPFQSGAPVQQQ
ncbi:MAG: O-antigen ligase family protein [Candidatus Margulisbacteria bacterium]|jgi:O-antigen ligase|nr:O-antigen ligase family protein [Candidatus Margulisiibacteriota bacterium]